MLNKDNATVIVDYLNRHKSRMSVKSICGHFHCGRHSGIPLCCMIFFVFLWGPLSRLSYFSLVKKFIYWYPPVKFGYVPCLFCFVLRRKAKIRNCSNDNLYCCQRKGQQCLMPTKSASQIFNFKTPKTPRRLSRPNQKADSL